MNSMEGIFTLALRKLALRADAWGMKAWCQRRQEWERV